jgi:hypothetical protein
MSAKQNKAKKAKKSRGSKPRKAQRMRKDASGISSAGKLGNAMGVGFQQVGQPLAYTQNYRGGTFEMTTIKHQVNGAGVRIRGSSALGLISKQNGYRNAFDAVVAPPSGCVSSTVLHPAFLFVGSTRSSNIVKSYLRFVFREIRVRYIPAVGTTENNQLLMVYNQDPTMAIQILSNTSWSFYLENPTCIRWQPWAAASITITDQLNQDFLGFYDTDTTYSVPAWRQQYQGCLNFVWQGLCDATTFTGTVELDYVVDLFDPIGSFNNVLSDFPKAIRDNEDEKKRRLDEKEKSGGGERDPQGPGVLTACEGDPPDSPILVRTSVPPLRATTASVRK